jgi:hypothetical protein
VALKVWAEERAVRAAAVRGVVEQPEGLAAVQTRAVAVAVAGVTILLAAQVVLVLWLFVI